MRRLSWGGDSAGETLVRPPPTTPARHAAGRLRMKDPSSNRCIVMASIAIPYASEAASLEQLTALAAAEARRQTQPTTR